MIVGALVVLTILGACGLLFGAGSFSADTSRAAKPSVFFWMLALVAFLGLACVGLGWWSP
jgi:hypothetical protein